MLRQKTKKGFTIIEVVLVLAIAGLIFLMVFVALPALQRSQRDTQRKNDLGRLTSTINSYMSNNRGKVPNENGTLGSVTSTASKYTVTGSNNTTNPVTAEGGDGDWGAFLQNYMHASGDDFADPSMGFYYLHDAGVVQSSYNGDVKDANGNVIGNKAIDVDEVDGVIYIFHQAKCGEKENTIVYSPGKRQLAFVYKMEGPSYYCGTN